MIGACWAMDTPPTLQAFVGNSMNNSNRSFHSFSTFLPWSLFNPFVPWGGFSCIRFFVNKTFKMAPLDQFFYLLFQLFTIVRIGTIVTMKKSVAIAMSFTGMFRIKT